MCLYTVKVTVSFLASAMGLQITALTLCVVLGVLGDVYTFLMN